MAELPSTAGQVGSQRQWIIPAPARTPDFEAFYRHEMPRVTVFLMHVGATAYEAADAAHEAFCALLPDKWATLEFPKAYLRTAAYRFYLRQATSRSTPWDPVPDRPGGTCPLATVLMSEEQRRIMDALALLPPAERQTMAWSLDGFNHEEIAVHLGKSPAAVRKSYQRARERLTALLVTRKEEAHD
ncbi:sigma-70 family RNA polymerase sigma factor [Streptomyces sp. NBC_00249]|uniref:RNA polymerase sigma factor n=1 Tax=Streptomyces sp. NBC_00249 TaxID=2975690 RepID=UPI00224EB6B8|nr:sigma-70 family RNA polymerase sigma factor [Streptomyces sp. NBC_00249]MCX5198626.1 sigma-70 family RNA polymerase sigma factor [Streptomyces sp. NBC_00249]